MNFGEIFRNYAGNILQNSLIACFRRRNNHSPLTHANWRNYIYDSVGKWYFADFKLDFLIRVNRRQLFEFSPRALLFCRNIINLNYLQKTIVTFIFLWGSAKSNYIITGA